MPTQPGIIKRREEDYIRKRGRPCKSNRNLNPAYHPFQRAREYTRALNATKLDRVFAKPFIGALPGSSDSIWRLSTIPKRLPLLASADCAGELRVWNTSKKTLEWSANAHEGFVRGLSANSSGEILATCGTDKTINIWSVHGSNEFAKGKEVVPKAHFLRDNSFTDIDWKWGENTFATSGDVVEFWDVNRTEPIQKFQWGSETSNTVKFNRVETHLLMSTASDRSIVLLDTRAKTPTKKLILKMVSNSLCWNPMEAFNFTIASEDNSLYGFDMRKMEKAKIIHQGHLNAVMSVDYSPTGKEFVSGSYDKTVRIFEERSFRSREVYHTKRMQRVFVTKFSLDGSFVFSGSNDTNIRIWKSNASEKLGALATKEKDYFNYCKKLQTKFSNMPEIRKISRHRQLPKQIHSQKKQREIMQKAQNRKRERFEENSKKKFNKKTLKEDVVVGIIE